MSQDAYWILIDWPEAVKRNTSPDSLWNAIIEAMDAACDFEDKDLDGNEAADEAPEQDDEKEEREAAAPVATWFGEIEYGWSYNAYLWTAFAYEEIRSFLPEDLRASTDAFMLPNITSLGGSHQDLGGFGDVLLVSLSPESVRKYLMLAWEMDISKLRAAYDAHCPKDIKEVLASYAGGENIENSFETAFKPVIESYIGYLRAADAEGRGFILAVR